MDDRVKEALHTTYTAEAKATLAFAEPAHERRALPVCY